MKRNKGINMGMGKMFKEAVCLFVIAAMTMTVSAVPVHGASFTDAVTGVKAVSQSFDSVKVSCKAKTGAKGYRFYVAKTKNGKYSLAAEANKNRAVITGLTTDKAYFFKVRAFKGKTLTKYSAAVKCTPKLAQPKGVSVKMTDIFNEGVEWNAVDGAKQYKVFRSKYKDKNFKLVGTVKEPKYRGGTIKEKTVYYYKVRAFRSTHKSKFSAVKKFTSPPNGNAAKYGLDSVTKVQDEVLTGKTVFFLGSSITAGLSAGGVSFTDYLETKYDMYCPKEAVSSTTMAVRPGRQECDSYVERLSQTDPTAFAPDAFVSQLSLNDSLAKNGVPLGTVPETCRSSIAEFDINEVDTVAESIEYITVYAREKWGCPIAFFTIKRCGLKNYDAMVELLHQAQDKWVDDQGEPPFAILDIWNDPTFMNVKGDTLKLCMRDNYHPTMAGYKKYWLPEMAKFLKLIMTAGDNPAPEPVVEPTENLQPEEEAIQDEPMILQPLDPEEEPLEQTDHEE